MLLNYLSGIRGALQCLDESQLTVIQDILNEIENNHFQKIELLEMLNIIKLYLTEIIQNKEKYFDQKLTVEVNNLSKIVDDPKLDVGH